MQQDQVPPARADCTEMVLRIRAGDPDARSDFYRILQQKLQFQLRHLCPENRQDVLHNVFLGTVAAITENRLKDPAAAVAFAQTVCRRRIADLYGAPSALGLNAPAALAVADGHPSPEAAVIQREQIELLASAIQRLGRIDREILRRFYLLEESQEEICKALGLSDTRFRNRKSRAKARIMATLQRPAAATKTTRPAAPPTRPDHFGGPGRQDSEHS